MSHVGGLIDIGANLCDKRFEGDIPGILQRAHEHGVTHIIVTGTSVPGSNRAINLCRRWNNVSPVRLFCTVGLHPHSAKSFLQFPKTFQTLERLVVQNKDIVVAVGECGLDYVRNFSPRELQLVVFRNHITLARKVNLPLFLHERGAFDDFVHILDDAEGPVRGVVHCFTGSVKEMACYLQRGLHIGITGWICDPKRGQFLKKIVNNIPLERLMLETDAPYLFPQNVPDDPALFPQIGSARSKKSDAGPDNEPMYLRWVLESVADSYDLDENEVAQATTRTARDFFKIPEN